MSPVAAYERFCRAHGYPPNSIDSFDLWIEEVGEEVAMEGADAIEEAYPGTAWDES